MRADSPNAALVARFYAAFARCDPEAMMACYHPDAVFSDPAFPELDRAGTAAMWRMLCARGKDLAVQVSGIEADAASGRAQWVATYTYPPTGRRVVNRIDAAFEFKAGLIVRHRDHFDLHRWLAQALGWRGSLLGWLPPVQQRVRVQAAKTLAHWRARHSAADAAR